MWYATTTRAHSGLSILLVAKSCLRHDASHMCSVYIWNFQVSIEELSGLTTRIWSKYFHTQVFSVVRVRPAARSIIACNICVCCTPALRTAVPFGVLPASSSASLLRQGKNAFRPVICLVGNRQQVNNHGIQSPTKCPWSALAHANVAVAVRAE